MHVRVGGQWMNDVAVWGGRGHSHDEKGCKELSIDADTPRGQRHPALHRGALVEEMLGPCVMWVGVLDEPDWVAGEFHALGLSYDASNFLARDGVGAPTATASVAVDRWIADSDPGPLSRDGVPTTAFAATADGSNTTAALLDSQADELGHRWSVRADRVVRMQADGTTPDYWIPPGVVELGNASDEYASAIAVTYLDMSSVPAYTTREDTAAAARFGYKEVPLDLTQLGPMTLARAQDYGDGILAKGRARLGWTSSAELTSHQLLTAGGVPCEPALVRDGQVVRIFGTVDDLVYLDGRTYLDVVIGTVDWPGGDKVTIGPVSSVVQTLSEAITALTEAVDKAEAA